MKVKDKGEKKRQKYYCWCKEEETSQECLNLFVCSYDWDVINARVDMKKTSLMFIFIYFILILRCNKDEC